MKTIQFIKPIDEIDLPFVKVTNGNFKGMIFLVDTGCNNSIIFTDSLEKYGQYLQMEPNEEEYLYGIDSIEHSVPVVMAKINIMGRKHESKFLLSDQSETVKIVASHVGLEAHGILGVNFFRLYGWVIDFNNEQIYMMEEKNK